MTRIAQSYTDRLSSIKKNIETSHDYFNSNYKRYNDFINFVFYSTMTDAEVQALEGQGKPTLEFNIVEAFVSRLRGEWVKHFPELRVRAAHGVPVTELTRQFNQTMEVVEDYIRSILSDAQNDKFSYNMYTDLLTGGFGVARVFTDYVSNMSFEQNIYVEHVDRPTMCGFDPLARDSHKGDGRYAYQLFPLTKGEIEDRYGKEATENMKFYSQGSIGGFSWSYANTDEKVGLVAEYFMKETKNEKIYELTNGMVVTKKEYERLLERWQMENPYEAAPVPTGKERYTTFERIDKYTLCESQMLEHETTDYRYLPLVFFDGNSIMIEHDGAWQQMTRPYIYNAKGIQRLKNYAGQCYANELENTPQQKFIVAEEALPDDPQALQAYKDVQKASTLTYKHFLDERAPEVTLPPPREVVRTPIPQQIGEAFTVSDQMTQAILGSYDNQQVSNGQISGIAFARSAMMSNTAAIPYSVGYAKGLNRVAEILVDMIPKYHKTPRSVPVVKSNGDRDYALVNADGAPSFNYDPNNLQVSVETGVNFAMQKEISLQTITGLMQSSKMFDEFMNAKGLTVILDNLDIRGIDTLKQKAQEYEQELAQRSQAEQQMRQEQHQTEMMQSDLMTRQAEKIVASPTPEEVEVMRVQEKAAKDAADSAAKEVDVQAKLLKVLNDIRQTDMEEELKRAELSAENLRTLTELLSKSELEMGDINNG